MKKVNFTPKTDIEEYLNNDFNIEVFEELTEDEDWQGLFEPLEFLNLLYEQLEFINENKEKPLSVVKHLLGLKLEKTQLYYLLASLHKTMYVRLTSQSDPNDKHLISICEGFIGKECDKLYPELYPETETELQPGKENKYDFQKVKQQLATLATANDKIKYLIEIKTDFLQNKDDWFIERGTPFDRKCELEINKLEKGLLLKAHTTTPKAKPIFKLSDKKGAKIDFIRVLNALYELRFFHKTDGQIPTKQEFIETMGEYLGADLSKYHSNLSQALQNQKLEVNLKVFEEMKEVTKNAHYQTKTK